MKSPIFSTIYQLKKPKVILVSSANSALLCDLAHFLIKKLFIADKAQVFGGAFESISWTGDGRKIIDVSERTPQELIFLMENASECIFILDWQDSQQAKSKMLEVWAALKSIKDPQKVKLVYNSDFNFGEDLSKIESLATVSFGKGNGAHMRISDVSTGDKTNFKINFNGKTLPVWSNGNNQSGEVNAVAACVCLAEIYGLNLVEMTQEFKYYTDFDRFRSVDNI